MKFRILSDLHLDINADIDLSLPHDGTFTLVCGDVSGDYKQAELWIKKNVDRGVWIEGNHIGYCKDRSKSIFDIQDIHRNNFPITNDVSYFENNYKIIGDYVIVGGTLWTDFMLDNNIRASKARAIAYMNDYRWNIKTIQIKEQEACGEKHSYVVDVPICPDDTIGMFHQTISLIKDVCEKYPNKKIIVISHHAPSPRSIDTKYLNSSSNSINSAYASNLDNFIREHTNIKMWCHGHVHNRCDYMIGQCRVICNPVGYTKFEDTNYDLNMVVQV